MEEESSPKTDALQSSEYNEPQQQMNPTLPPEMTVPPGIPVTSAGNSKGRKRISTRVVAYVDFVLILFGEMMAIWGMLDVLAFLEYANKQGIHPGIGEEVLCLVVALYAVVIISLLVEVYFTCLLLKATEVATPLIDAISKAERWIFFNLFLIILAIAIGGISTVDGLSLGSGNFLFAMIRSTLSVVVYQFIKELGLMRHVVTSGIGYAKGVQSTIPRNSKKLEQPFQQQNEQQLHPQQEQFNQEEPDQQQQQ